MSEPLQYEQLSDTEKIALLLGWHQGQPYPTHREYSHPSGSIQCVGGQFGGAAFGPLDGADWPDITDQNTVKAVEAKIIAEGLADAYMMELYQSNPVCPLAQPWRWASSAWVLLTATPALKIDAALAVWEARKPAPPPPMAPPDSIPVKAIVWLLTIGWAYGIVFVMRHSS